MLVVGAAEIDGCYRYSLTRWGWLAPTDHTVCFIMMNPSTADAVFNDPTISRCINFAQSWGFTRLSVVNLYPFRSSSPQNCRAWHEINPPGYADAMDKNRARIVSEAHDAEKVIAAWGALAWDGEHVEGILKLIDRSIYCLGLTAGRFPKHPLARGKHRVPDRVIPQLFWPPP